MKHRITATLALALCLHGCSLIREPAPSGEPVELDHSAAICSANATDASAWVEGLLRADISWVDPILGGTRSAVTGIAIKRAEIGASPEPDPADWRIRVVPVHWPSEYTGVRLATGEVAVLGATGNLVAMTGRAYRLQGDLLIEGAIGGPLFGQPGWPAGFDVCLPSSP